MRHYFNSVISPVPGGFPTHLIQMNGLLSDLDDELIF